MNRFVSAALALPSLGLAAPSASSAQAVIVLGGGLTLPMSDYNTYAKPGWLGHAGVAFPVGEGGFSVGGHGYYGSNSHDDFEGDETNLYGGLVSLGMNFGDPEGPYPQVFALVGSMTHSYQPDSSRLVLNAGPSTSLALGGGAEVDFPLGSVTGNVGAVFLTGLSDNKNTRILGIDIGLGIPVGGGGM